jgi:hypothetical protein
MNLTKMEKPIRFIPIQDANTLGTPKIVGRPYVYENPYYNIEVDEEIVDNQPIIKDDENWFDI